MCPPFMKLIPVSTPWRTLNIPTSWFQKRGPVAANPSPLKVGRNLINAKKIK